MADIKNLQLVIGYLTLNSSNKILSSYILENKKKKKIMDLRFALQVDQIEQVPICWFLKIYRNVCLRLKIKRPQLFIYQC